MNDDPPSQHFVSLQCMKYGTKDLELLKLRHAWHDDMMKLMLVTARFNLIIDSLHVNWTYVPALKLLREDLQDKTSIQSIKFITK